MGNNNTTLSEIANKIARKRINDAKNLDVLNLNLSELGLENNDLERLLPDIKKIPGLRDINLSGNVLTELPESIGDLSSLTQLILFDNNLTRLPESIGNLSKLTLLNLEKNKLMQLPESMSRLSNLTMLNVAENKLTQLPESIGNLSRLIILNASDNRLVYLPESLSNLDNIIVDANFNANPLLEETRNWLDHNFTSSRIHYNMAAFNTTLSVEEVLKTLFKDKKELADIMAGLEACDVSTEIPGKEVLETFLRNIPISYQHELNLYGLPAKRLLMSVLDKDRALEERSNILAKIATSLGDCATPIKAFLMQERIAQLVETAADKLSKKDRVIIERQALSEEAGKLKSLKSKEKIEQVQGLVNSIYLKGAENNPVNPNLRIIGDRKRLPSISRYPDFIFRIVNENHDLIREFTCLCCKTDKNNKPITENGMYLLDREKMKMIRDDYMADLGLVQGNALEREKYINLYKEVMEIFLRKPEMEGLYTEYFNDAQDLLDIPTQQQELKRLLRKEGTELEAVYNKYLSEKQLEIKNLIIELKGGKMNKYMTPINQGENSKSASPEPDRGNRRGQENSETRNVSPRR